MNTHDTLIRLDPNGRTVVGIFLKNVCKTVWLYEEDYSRIIKTYGISSWRMNSAGNGFSYVRTKYQGENVMVARLVLGDLHGANVRLKDKNPCNLRRDNLYYGRGRGGDECTRKRRKRKPLGTPQTSPEVTASV